MTCAGIHQNDIGTQIKIKIVDSSDVAIDISAATLKQIVFKKPSGASVTKLAAFLTDGTDGYIRYIIVDGDLDEVGTWKVQAIITIDGSVWHSQFESFRVLRNL